MQTKHSSTLQKKRALQGRYVKARLVERGISIMAVARNIGCTPQTVTNVLHGRRAGTRSVRPAIARLLGTPQDRLWPENNRAA